MISRLNETAIESSYLGKEQRIYTLDIKWGQPSVVDVIVVQDGKDYLDLGAIQEATESVMMSNIDSESHMFLVCIPPSHSHERYDWYHPNGKEHESYLHFIQEEVVRYVKRKWENETVQIGKMGLLGDSLGASVNVSLAIRSPKTWSHLLLQSGVFFEEQLKALYFLEGEIQWKVYQVVGLYEHEVVYPLTREKFPVLSYNQMLYQQLKQTMSSVTYFEEHEDHVWDFWKRDVPRALSFFLKTDGSFKMDNKRG